MKRCVTDSDSGPERTRAVLLQQHLSSELTKELDRTETEFKRGLAELFFLQNGGNLLDFNTWYSKPNPYLNNYIQQIITADNEGVGPLLEKIPTGLTVAVPSTKQEAESGTPFMLNMASIARGDNGIVERAKQEAIIVQQVALLKKQGVWSLKRLPKVKEPNRIKTQWDYLLEEMQWLATDFHQEKKWKKAAAKKLAMAVAKVFEEKELAEQRKAHEEANRMRRIANNIAKDVMKMWGAVEKVLQYKQDSQLEERRKKLMDTHLNFIVGQTEQYSSWLADGMTKDTSSVMMTPSSQDGDIEFKPPKHESSDDEATIAAAEEECKDEVEDEIKQLQSQSLMDMDELVKSLPPGMLEGFGKELDLSSDYTEGEEESEDDETTIKEHEGDQEENAEELGDLEKEKDVPLDELIARYKAKKEACGAGSNKEGSGVSSKDGSGKESGKEGSSKTGRSSQSEETATEDTSMESTEQEESEDSEGDVSDMDADIEYSDPPEVRQKSSSEMDHELGELLKEAKQSAPTGNTLKSASVQTKIPFLMRGTLREYQHIGLDWLVAMDQKKLNGILADEMGLGKTIQTIALLAHLACFKGIWGPHLIIVPTSVLLNWDLEFKKWCPGFKVMSYYGSQKERKEKRVGWTKPNYFHVCVTSYKLVVQDYRAFRSKKWYYMILDEAHNIKNFKSQRWQLLLNFNSQRRLLLTGTPLQNHLMELWSLMHFLMPTVFGSQKAFKEWFSNPLTGMVEGTQEYNEQIIKRLHKVLRPFLLRRLKKEVELQLPSKSESVIMCGLSRRQRALYEEFLARSSTRETLGSGQFISVIGVLMQLRKVCNHPDLFEPRPVVSPLSLHPLLYSTPTAVLNALNKPPLASSLDCEKFNLNLADYELGMSAYSAHRTQQLKTHRLLIEEIDYKGAVPDNPEYCASSHSTFPPPRITPTLPPLPILRQMPSMPNLQPSPRVPRTSPRPPPSPRQLSSMSGSDSSGLTPPPLTYLPSSAKSSGKGSPGTPSQNIVPAGYFRDPVSNMVLPLVDPGMPPPRRPFPPQLTRRTGSRVPRYTSKRGAPGLPPALTPGSCSSPEPPTLRAASLPPALSPARQDVVEYSPKSSWESPSRSSDTGPESCEEPEFEQKHSINYGPLYLPSLEDLRQAWRYSRRRMLADTNDLRCQRVPMYGSDLVSAVTLGDRLPNLKYTTVEERLEELTPILSRYLLFCPTVVAPAPLLTTAPPLDTPQLDHELKPRMGLYHPIKSKISMTFPETRLIQYDCGKLQTLDRLLSRLKKETHRVLIFTQMTKMLDVLESFLNFHAHTYMRLDGTTKVDKRLELMERFNQDDKVFCMILSTRSGGVGVNLTGADTVIFYDSDWNPTMDAQAQDRCHRIGQTRDVHIYRLVCERTVEENILKKANQKRLLGAVAIEDGHFTTAFFKKDNLSELFGTSVVVPEAGVKASPKHRTIAKGDLEKALAAAEDVEDVTAASRAKGEIIEELTDFDEEQPIKGEKPLSDAEKEVIQENKEFTKAEEEVIAIENELTPVERYALKFLENENQDYLEELIRQQDEELTAAKPEATLADLQSAKQDEEFMASQDQNDVLLTYASWDPKCEDEEDPYCWYPPTPPHQSEDVYHHDPVMQSLYSMDELMMDDSLPPVTIIPNLTFPIIPPSIYIKEEPQDPPPPPAPCLPVPITPAHQPIKVEASTPSLPISVEEATVKHRSSTPQPSTKDDKPPFLRGVSSDMSRKDMNKRHKKTKLKIKPTEPLSENSDDRNAWLLSEEYALHQSVMSIQETSPSLSSINEYNWDIVSDILNISSSSYRTPRQCRERYTLLVHREDINTEQSRFNKGMMRPGMPPRGVNPPGGEDAGHASTQHFVKIFQEIDKLGFNKPEIERKSLTLSSIMPNSGHTDILNSQGGDESPVVLAAKRKERENKENKERATQHQRKELEAKRIDMIQVQNNNVQKIQEVPQRPVTNNLPHGGYHMPRKMNEMAQGQAPRGPTISVMTSNKMGFPQHTPIYLVPQAQGQRPIQVQQQVNMAGGNMMQQGKQILVNTNQQHVKMPTHVNFIPGTQVRTPQGTHQYIPCTSNDEMINQMKRGQYRAPSPIGHPNNLIPINMLSKPFISQQQQQYMPQQMRGSGQPKGVRSMHPAHPPIMRHVMDGSDGMHHGPRMMMGNMGPPGPPNMPPSSAHQIPSSPHQVPSPVHHQIPSSPHQVPSPVHHQMPASPQVMQQIKQTASTSRNM